MSTPEAGSATMRVDPAEVVRLKTRLEAVRATVSDFVLANSHALAAVPFAEDVVSQEASQDFTENAGQAIDVTRQFIDQLNLTIEGLQGAVDTYNLADDTHAMTMRNLGSGIGQS
ncbi:PE domain-containing protein [Umezawaea sp. Da 62-37]|uniref:PE domain-containing protein n=1 Tax=Umezawaea sp. Da 62-37 TaxID=3075927 RepID=UPI0028F6DB87|nr:PE domain-containing protein [Umezawaea sp. Da 62-37]WNV83750.1 PE domain-containing protein [Umezawaea sp. Da 62-37]